MVISLNPTHRTRRIYSPHILRPPVTIIVCPFTYENHGLATPTIDRAASSGLAGLPRGISGYSWVGAFPVVSPFRAASCFPGIPSATFVPSGAVMKAPASLAAVSRVVTCPKAIVLARTPNAGPHSLAIVLVRPTIPALARA